MNQMEDKSQVQQTEKETILSLPPREAVVQYGISAAQEILKNRGFLEDDVQKYIQEYAPDRYGTPTEAALPSVMDKMASRAWSVVKSNQAERDRIPETDDRSEEEKALRQSWDSFHELAIIQDSLKAGKPDEAIAKITKARDSSLEEVEQYAEKLPPLGSKEPQPFPFVGRLPLKDSFYDQQEFALNGSSFLEAAYNYTVLNKALK